jgi:hypothetical protein
MIMRMSIALCLLASAAPAQTLMTAEEFDAWSTGAIMDWATNEDVYERLKFLPGRQILWDDFEGSCKTGRWYPKNGDICFDSDGGSESDGKPEADCVTVLRNGDRVILSYGDDPSYGFNELYKVDDPLTCDGSYEGS